MPEPTIAERRKNIDEALKNLFFARESSGQRDFLVCARITWDHQADNVRAVLAHQDAELAAARHEIQRLRAAPLRAN